MQNVFLGKREKSRRSPCERSIRAPCDPQNVTKNNRLHLNPCRPRLDRRPNWSFSKQSIPLNVFFSPFHQPFSTCSTPISSHDDRKLPLENRSKQWQKHVDRILWGIFRPWTKQQHHRRNAPWYKRVSQDLDGQNVPKRSDHELRVCHCPRIFFFFSSNDRRSKWTLLESNWRNDDEESEDFPLDWDSYSSRSRHNPPLPLDECIPSVIRSSDLRWWLIFERMSVMMMMTKWTDCYFRDHWPARTTPVPWMIIIMYSAVFKFALVKMKLVGSVFFASI